MSKKQWGNCVWITFHTISEKLKFEYDNEASIILKYIIDITTILPCSYCREHSNKTLSKINFSSIKNKNDLKMFLYEFHNIVNNDTKKQKQDICILNNYSKYNLKKVLTYFFKIMNYRYGTLNSSIFISMNKKRILNNFNLYLRKNYYKFNN